MTKFYQWTKGEKVGSAVKWEGDQFVEDNIEYMVFKDGSILNKRLLGEFLIEIPSEEEAVMMHDLAPQPLQRISQKPKPAPVEIQPTVSPLEKLLSDSKKNTERISITIDVDMPSIDLMKVLSDSYENGEELIIKYLSSSIDADIIRKKVAEQIKDKVFTKKLRNKKNERI